MLRRHLLLAIIILSTSCRSQTGQETVYKAACKEQYSTGRKTSEQEYKWSLTQKEILKIISLSTVIDEQTIHDAYPITPCYIEANGIELNGKKVNVSINGGSFLHVEDGSQTIVMGCDKPECASFFLLPPENHEEDAADMTSTVPKAASQKWWGTYSFSINENSSDWRDIQEVTLSIGNDSIFFHVEGYQIDQNYKLSSTESDNRINLIYDQAIDHSESAVLEQTKDFGTIKLENGQYLWKCPYIDLSFGNGKPKTYKLKRSQ